MDAIRQILIKYWGYPNFRPRQEEIIQSILAGHDTLALLPTGGGKSICYQVPGLVLDGITLVITPLIALMKDQVDNLKTRNIKAVALYSGMNAHEYELAMNQVTHGEAKFLYLSPERLLSEKFTTILPTLNVKLIAVDEAHCISQWGYDFRPPYLQIAEIRPFFPKVPVLALTATATPAVAEDIQLRLKFKNGKFLSSSFMRKNLIYFVANEENKLQMLLKLVQKQQGTGIVYVRNRKKTKEISDFLQNQNISASYYHAGLDSRIRDQKQKQWKEGFTRVIVATNAFGMGIDKDNVRFVAHLDLPDNPEAYFQEAGRGGRDGKTAWSIIFWDKADILNLHKNFETSYPPLDVIKNTYQALGNYFRLALGSGEGQSFNFDLSDFARQYQIPPLIAFNSLKIVEKEGLIMLNDAIYHPSQIKILMNGNDLYRFQVENAVFDNLIKFILRTYSAVFQQFTSINESQIVQAFGITKEQVREKLQRLKKLEVLDYVPENNEPKIIFVKERLDISSFKISPENYEWRKKAAKERQLAMINYIQSDHKCRSQQLLSYFGEITSQRCGQCDVCLKRNKTDLSKLEFDRMVELIKPILKATPLMLDDLVFKIETDDVDKLINTISWLQENGKISDDENHVLHWVS
jgi:ATP-dependent DNA helicase RecQ